MAGSHPREMCRRHTDGVELRSIVPAEVYLAAANGHAKADGMGPPPFSVQRLVPKVIVVNGIDSVFSHAGLPQAK